MCQSMPTHAQQDVEPGAVAEADGAEIEVHAADRMVESFAQSPLQDRFGVDVDVAVRHDNLPVAGRMYLDLQPRAGGSVIHAPDSWESSCSDMAAAPEASSRLRVQTHPLVSHPSRDT
uniref:Uncharacterized protein n=1 Tax=Streptomyces avermitilis TaxID=33903 RepID=A0A499V695_STRAX|nr:hypothetical protein SAVMC3_24430 [Streptomyces avermitilis]